MDKFSYAYLCVDNIGKFNCTKFNNFEEADNFHNLNNNNLKYSTIIFVCKYIPSFFHKYIIKYKLSDIFVGKINIK